MATENRGLCTSQSPLVEHNGQPQTLGLNGNTIAHVTPSTTATFDTAYVWVVNGSSTATMNVVANVQDPANVSIIPVTNNTAVAARGTLALVGGLRLRAGYKIILGTATGGSGPAYFYGYVIRQSVL